MLEDRDQVSRENCELKSDEATRSSRTRTFIAGKKGTLGYVVMYCFYKNLLFLLSSSDLCLVTRENRDKGILNVPLTPNFNLLIVYFGFCCSTVHFDNIKNVLTVNFNILYG
jgi:hypothetical protein